MILSCCFGYQDAKKGVLFIDFPPVLQLQLKRFEYDFMRDTMVKVSTSFFFLSLLYDLISSITVCCIFPS